MAETFDTVETDAGSGGAKVAGDTFTQDATSKFVAASYIVFGAAGGPYERVNTSTGLPIAFNTVADGSGTEKRAITDTDGHLQIDVLSCASHAVTNAGTFAVQASQTGTWTVDLGATDNAVLDSILSALQGTLTVGSHAVTDGGGSLTVDAPVGTPVFVRLSDGSSAISTLPVSLASVPSHAVTNAGTFAVQESGSALTALQLIDDAIYVDDADWTATTSKHALIGGIYQSSPGTITDGDTGPLRVNENGALHVAIVSGAGSGGTASDDDADFTAGSTSGTPAMGVYESSPSSVTDGDMGIVGITQTRAMRVSVDNTVTVASHAVTNAGTFAVQAAQSGTWTVDLGATDNAVLDAIAASLATLDNIVSGSEAQVDIVASLPAGTNNIGDVDVLSVPQSIRGPSEPTIDSYTSAAVSASANTANQSLIAAPGASKQIWVYGLILTADTGDGSFSLQDEDDTAASGVMAISQRGGFVIPPSGNFSMPWFKVATNKALEIDTVTCGAKGIISYAVVSI